MIVVHGLWLAGSGNDQCLALWGEDSLGVVTSKRRSGRRPKVLDHHFAATPEDLAVLTGHLETPRDYVGGAVVLSLPTRGGAPVPSPEVPLLNETADEAARNRQAARPARETLWRVPCLRLDADAALVFLAAVQASGGLTVGYAADAELVLAPDVRWLSRLAGFAGDMAARGRVLPAVRAAGTGQALALWSPLVLGTDAVWLRSAATALPPSGLAGRVGFGNDSHDRLQIVVTATDALVDAAVRASVGPAPKAAANGRKKAHSGAANAARLWRAALVGTNRTFVADADEVAELACELGAWQADATTGAAVRACFRLVEPGAEPDSGEDIDRMQEDDSGKILAPNDHWRLEFALQASDEPSLIVNAPQVWRSRGALRTLARHVPRPQEAMLTELGRAVRLYPELERGLRTARPVELRLDACGAHDFLELAAPVLLAGGFGVLLPSWWTSPSVRLGARLTASTPAQPGSVGNKSSIGQDGLVDFQWELAVGEHTLSEREVADLVQAQQPLVRIRGQWLQVDPARLAAARAFLDRRGAPGTMSVAEVLHAASAPDAGPGGLPVTGIDAHGWLGDLLSSDRELRIEEVPVPAGFSGTLRPYQERGLAWLAFLESVGMGAVLADDMGLGKTIQLLALMARDAELNGQRGVGPTLLVCPMSLVGNWEREAAKFTPGLRVHVHHGSERTRGRQFTDAVNAADVVVTTYALLARDIKALGGVQWRRVVLDEAQAIKNAATKAAAAARSLPASRRIAVTGTPVENRLADLWSLMHFANPKLLGTADAFRESFALPIERRGDEDAAARLRALTQPFVLRRLKTDRSIITDLPEKLEMEVVCSLTAEQAGLYQNVVADMLERIESSEGIERRGLVLATMTKLKQVCNHPAQFLHDNSRVSGRSGKLARLEETLEEVLDIGEKAITFTQYAEFGGMLRSHLSARFGCEVAFLYGNSGKAQRDAMVSRFQREDRSGPALMVLSLKAGGTGLNLTAANHVIHYDRWWNPAVEDQATDRAFRIGQSRAVQVRKFVCAGTLEEKIADMIRDKRGLADRIVGTGEGWLTELSTGQLRELFTLEPGAVIE